jgi:hypothetical protein
MGQITQDGHTYLKATSRQPYKGCVLVATADNIRDQAIWHASVGIGRLIQGSWQVMPIDPGLSAKEFRSVADALSAALAHGQLACDRGQCYDTQGCHCDPATTSQC